MHLDVAIWQNERPGIAKLVRPLAGRFAYESCVGVTLQPVDEVFRCGLRTATNDHEQFAGRVDTRHA